MNPHVGLIVMSFLTFLAGCQAMVTVEPPTPTPEVSIPLTAVMAERSTIAGRVLWGTTPVAGAPVELRTGAWADPGASESIARTVSGNNGEFQLEAPPAGGEFGLVARWPDGSANQAPVTPVQIGAGQAVANVEVYLARTLEMLEPTAGAEVAATPTLRWAGLPGVAAYHLWIIDAGTTELVFDLVITDTTEVVQVVAPPLTPGRTYNWTVTGLAANNGDSSSRNLLAGLAGQFKVKPADTTGLPVSSWAITFEHRALHEPCQRHDGQVYLAHA
jgi:hypothetical protein